MNALVYVMLGATLTSCDVPRPRAAPSDSAGGRDAAASAESSPSSQAAVAAPVLAPKAAFPPAPYDVAARITGKEHSYCFVVRSGAARDYALPVGECGAGEFGGEPAHLPSIVRIQNDACEPVSDRVAGLPPLGMLDLNLETDRVFGVEHAPPQVTVDNEHAGSRMLVAIDADSPDPDWMVSTRRESSTAQRVSSELYRWTAARWRRVEASPLGVEWRFARPFHQGLLFVSRDLRWSGDRMRGVWSMSASGARGGVMPVFAKRDDDAACGARVLAFDVFPTGVVLSAGATCQGALLIERWDDGVRDAAVRVLPSIDVGVIDPSPERGHSMKPLDPLDVPLEIHGAGRVRVRARDRRVFDVDFEDKTRDWVVHPSPEPLAVDRARDAFPRTDDDHILQSVERSQSGVTYASVAVRAHRYGDLMETLLLRDRPMGTACQLSEPESRPVPR
jgi:hypothetical protein